MKAIDLLKYLEKADPAYVEEASDYQIRLLRKRQRRTRAALAACLALVVLAGVVCAKPVLYAWETRNLVTSWTDRAVSLGGSDDPKEDCPVYISAQMPDRKRFSADTPFTLSVGLGQASDYGYATLSVNAPGFEITDGDGNTATDRYVRTLSDFNGGDYGMLYAEGKTSGRITGCSYLEDFTFRFVGSEDTAWGSIQLSLLSRDGSSRMEDSVTVYYVLQNGVLRLTDKNPARGEQSMGAELEEVTEEGAVTLSKEDISVQVSLEYGVAVRGQSLNGIVEIHAFHVPTRKDYPTEGFTAELVCAETLRETDCSFFLKKPAQQNADGSTVIYLPRVPDDAPIGAYDLRITDPETGFVWVFENMVSVLPPDVHAYEDFVFEAFPLLDPLLQGGYWPSDGWEPYRLTENGEDATFLCRAELQYGSEEDGTYYSITIEESALSSHVPPDFIPADAPVGSYDLVVTHAVYGYTWRAEDFATIRENPDAERFGLSHDMEEKLTVSLSSGLVYTFTATVENRGDPFTVTETNDGGFRPEATLTQTSADGGNSENVSVLATLAVTGPYQEPYERTVHMGDVASQTYEILLTPDTPCGLYDLVLSYGDSVRVFADAVEVVP